MKHETLFVIAQDWATTATVAARALRMSSGAIFSIVPRCPALIRILSNLSMSVFQGNHCRFK